MNHLRSGVQDHPGQHGETPSLLKIQRISWAWRRVPVIPATQEAEAEELLEPGKKRKKKEKKKKYIYNLRVRFIDLFSFIL